MLNPEVQTALGLLNEALKADGQHIKVVFSHTYDGKVTWIGMGNVPAVPKTNLKPLTEKFLKPDGGWKVMPVTPEPWHYNQLPSAFVSVTP